LLPALIHRAWPEQVVLGAEEAGMIQVPSYVVAFVLAFVMTGFALAVLKTIEIHGF
jgi:hypothetical protein